MDGYFSRRRGSFKAYLTVQANPGTVVTVAGSRTTYTGTADGTTGIATFEVKKKDTYTITTNSGADSNAEGNTPTISINKTGSRYTAQMVKIAVPTTLSVANYSSNALTAYWARPTANWSGVNLRRNTGSAPANREAGTSVYSGVGNMGIIVNASTNVNGYTNTGLTASTTYYYSIFSYLNINGTAYWSTTYRTGAATATNYVGLSATITSTRNWSIPAGWRSIQVFCVGGGGGGYRGGGGGGYTRTSSSISVTPGTSYPIQIGRGGTAGGGRGETTSFGSLVSAAGGYGGEGNNGGAGGSGGGARGIYRGDSYDCDGSAGASDGAKARDNTYYTGAAQAHTYYGGNGQGSTTRAWGSSSGALYAGGGGGGSSNRNYSGGAGGAGGGGRGSSSYTISGTAGTNNTGGGGGGGAYDGSADATSSGGAGGSGIMLIKCVA